MPYTPNPTWADGSGGGTPITAAKLNNIEAGIEDADTRLTAMGVYAAYTPTLTGSTSNPTLGAAPVQSGRWAQAGKTVHCFGRIMVGGAGFAAGSGNYQVSLPVAANVPIANSRIGMAAIYDASGAVIGQVMCQFAGTSTGFFIMAYPLTWPTGTITTVSNNTPFVWQSSDEILWNITYEAA